jgi:hypothetical protein
MLAEKTPCDLSGGLYEYRLVRSGRICAVPATGIREDFIYGERVSLTRATAVHDGAIRTPGVRPAGVALVLPGRFGGAGRASGSFRRGRLRWAPAGASRRARARDL